jgi:D-tyrosyl-tRNA(Tyr) deacylase
MRALIQRVTRASVKIHGDEVRQIGAGLVVFLGITHDDDRSSADYIVDKIAGLRIFRDQSDKMNLSIADINGQCLIVSQFTLYGDTRRGRRPSFIAAAPPPTAIPLYDYTVERLRLAIGQGVQSGEFGADMLVEIVNDGPVTLMIESQ